LPAFVCRWLSLAWLVGVETEVLDDAVVQEGGEGRERCERARERERARRKQSNATAKGQKNKTRKLWNKARVAKETEHRQIT
jgi:hypothetical protein